MNKDILKGLFGDQEGVLSESVQQQITEAFNAQVDEKVNLALDIRDKENTTMLQEVVEKYEDKIKTELTSLEEKIDEEHATITEEAFAVVEKDRAAKMVQVKEHYEGLLNEGVEKQTKVIVEGLDKYLDTFLEQHVPKEVIAEAAKRDRNTELLNKITKIVSIDKTVTEDVRKGVADANNVIEEQASKIEKLQMKEFLQEKTKNLPVLEQRFIVENLCHQTLDYAERNFDYVRQLFSKKQSNVLKEQKTTANNIDRQTAVLEESTDQKVVEEAKPNAAMAVWVNKSMTNQFYGKE